MNTNFWIYFMIFFLMIWPFILSFYIVKKSNTANVLDNLREKEELINITRKVFKICEHVAICSRKVLLSCGYVNLHASELAAYLVNKSIMLSSNSLTNKKIEWSKDDEKIMKIFEDETLNSLGNDFSKIADKCKEVSSLNIKKLFKDKEIQDFFKKFIGMSDNEIIHYFISDEVLNKCIDLAFVENYIKNILNN